MSLLFFLQARVAEVGGGDAVQQFIRNLPPAPRPTPVPVPAAFPRTPRQRPIQEQTRGASRPMSLSERINVTSEIDSLKKQVEEMKQMLQISFELQMDTQRAIRQEVSAVFGAFMQQWMASQTGVYLFQDLHFNITVTVYSIYLYLKCIFQ